MKFWKTIGRFVGSTKALYIWGLVVQFFMILSHIMTYYLLRVLTDVLQHTLDKADFLEKAFIVILSGGKGEQFLYDNMWVMPVAVLVMGIIAALLAFYRTWLRGYTATRIYKNMQFTLFDHLERLPYSFFKKHKSGDLIQTLTRDTDVVRKFIVSQVSNSTYTIYTVVICFTVLMITNWQFTLIALSPLPVMFIYSAFLIKSVRKRYRAADDSEAMMTDKISENLNAARIVKAYNNEVHEIESFETKLVDYRKKFVSWRMMSSFFFASSDIFVFGAKALAIFLGIVMVVANSMPLSLLVISTSFVEMMVWPLRDLATSLSDLGQTIASVDRINLVLDAELEDVSSGLTPSISGDIIFDNVSYAFDDDKEHDSLSNISFHIKPGQTIAIMGKTGSGKSTLSLLLTRLYDYTGGSIKIDGVELKDIQKRHVRKNIVPVLQDPFLFSKTIYENIKVAQKDANLEDVKAAARLASVDYTIESLQHGYETAVGEKGITLSGGQKQRVAIARTIMSKAPVLIFDDSLSAVDTKTDLEIRNHLKELKDQTTIIITHRVATAKDADLIIVLEDGKIAEMGTHEELSNKEGLYQRINAIQSKMA